MGFEKFDLQLWGIFNLQVWCDINSVSITIISSVATSSFIPGFLPKAGAVCSLG